MIALIDIKKQVIELYDENGKKTISLSDFDLLKMLTKDKEIFYVTNVLKTNSDNIIKTINSWIKGKKIKLKKSISSNEKLYLVSTAKQHTLINDLGLKIDGIGFSVPLKEFQEKYGESVLNSHPALKKLIKESKLTIVTESRMKEIKQSQYLEEEQRQKLEDEELESMLVDGPVDKLTPEANVSRLRGRDVVDIDMTNEFSGTRTIPKKNDAENESELLPEDFE